jgi:hypothetical protein
MRQILEYIVKNKEWIFSGIGVLLLSATFLFGRNLLNKYRSRNKPKEANERDTTILRGTVTIPLDSGKVHNVFYPRKFQTPPFLTVNLVSGRLGFDLVEQRSDGFKISTYGGGHASGNGVKIEWMAEGEFTSPAQIPSNGVASMNAPIAVGAGASLKSPNKSQQSEIELFEPDEKDKLILRYLYRSDVSRVSSLVAEAVNLDLTETEYRLNRLIKHRFVRRPSRRIGNLFPEYPLLDRGVEYVLNMNAAS